MDGGSSPGVVMGYPPGAPESGRKMTRGLLLLKGHFVERQAARRRLSSAAPRGTVGVSLQQGDLQTGWRSCRRSLSVHPARIQRPRQSPKPVAP